MLFEVILLVLELWLFFPLEADSVREAVLSSLGPDECDDGWGSELLSDVLYVETVLAEAIESVDRESACGGVCCAAGSGNNQKFFVGDFQFFSFGDFRTPL